MFSGTPQIYWQPLLALSPATFNIWGLSNNLKKQDCVFVIYCRATIFSLSCHYFSWEYTFAAHYQKTAVPNLAFEKKINNGLLQHKFFPKKNNSNSKSPIYFNPEFGLYSPLKLKDNYCWCLLTTLDLRNEIDGWFKIWVI